MMHSGEKGRNQIVKLAIWLVFGCEINGFASFSFQNSTVIIFGAYVKCGEMEVCYGCTQILTVNALFFLLPFISDYYVT